MSETTPDHPAGQDGKDGAHVAAGAAAKAAGPPVPMIAIVLVALIAGAATGVFLVAPSLIQTRQKTELASRIADAEAGPQAKKKKNKKESKGGDHGAEAGKSPLYRIDNVIVNPAGSLGQRFLMCSVAVELHDEKLVDILRQRDIEVRDVVISTLESNTLAQLTQPGARDSLRESLAHALHPLLGEEGEDEHLRVFLPQFVIQ